MRLDAGDGPTAGRPIEEPPTTDVADASDEVLIVHGTFNSPSEGQTLWYQLPQTDSAPNFASALRDSLAAHGLPDGVRRESQWSWSGGNAHHERLAAGLALAEHVKKLGASRPGTRFHLVAHSHGGNVVLHAIQSLGLDRHLVGRVVFLGTPFVRRYRRSRSWLEEITRGITDVGIGLPVALAYLYAMVALFWFLASLTPWIPDFEPDGREWPTWLLTGMGLLLGMLFLNVLTTAVRWSTNLYYHRPLPDYDVDALRKTDALVVSAPSLDEAVVGLTAAPIVKAGLLTPLRELLCPKASFRRDADVGTSPSVSVTNGIRSIFDTVRSGLYFVARPAWAGLYYLVVERVLLRLIDRLFASLTLGLPGNLLAESYIRVSARLGEPRAFNEHFWDVTQILATEGHSEPVDPRSASSDYLWDDEHLAARLSGSPEQSGPQATVVPEKMLHKAIEEHVRMAGSYGGLERDSATARLTLLRNYLRLGDKVSEVLGNVQLEHSEYYARAEIVDSVASFLAHGQAPESAERADPEDRLRDRHSHLAPRASYFVLGTLSVVLLPQRIRAWVGGGAADSSVSWSLGSEVWPTGALALASGYLLARVVRTGAPIHLLAMSLLFVGAAVLACGLGAVTGSSTWHATSLAVHISLAFLGGLVAARPDRTEGTRPNVGRSS